METDKTKTNLVFTYGTLKKGFCNHYLLKTSKFINKGVTKGQMFSFGSFPAVDIKQNGKVTGEIYKVDDVTFKELDRLEEYPSWYDRKIVNIIVKNEILKAWIYTIPKEKLNGKKIVKEGEWKKVD